MYLLCYLCIDSSSLCIVALTCSHHAGTSFLCIFYTGRNSPKAGEGLLLLLKKRFNSHFDQMSDALLNGSYPILRVIISSGSLIFLKDYFTTFSMDIFCKI